MNKIKILCNIFVMAFVLASCATTNPEAARTVSAPSAQIKVETQKTPGGNTELNLQVADLSPPNSVVPGANVYVVWAEDFQNNWTANLGALTLDKDLVGKLDTITAMKDFKVFITPEESAAIPMPTNQAVLTALVHAEEQ